jgi:hypothetical protein
LTERGTFEEQTADALRNLSMICAVLAAGLVIAIGLAGLGFKLASSANDAVKASLANQTANRTKNVAVWCGSINQGRDYDRAFVRGVTRGRVKYRLGDLPCKALERNTLASTKPTAAQKRR